MSRVLRPIVPLVCLVAVCVLARPLAALAQGVTSSSVTGTVSDDSKKPMPGVAVTAVHVPSGTTYTAVTRQDGKFDIPGMRIGGPYTITAAIDGFEPQTTKDVVLNLGTNTTIEFSLKLVGVKESVNVTATVDPVLTASVTGATTTVDRESLARLPTISGRLESVARLSPQSGGGMSFLGQDSRSNNITIDGSYFNNSFGLGNTPGDRTGVAAISLASLEQIQINAAPYDVRQGGFVGAGVNSVTRSGTNDFSGSAYHAFRNQGMVGKTAGGGSVNPGTFTYGDTGFWAGGPIEPGKSFFFTSFENEALSQPGTTFVANQGGQTVGGNTTRVLASDLDTLSTFLKTNFNYDTGPYQGYNFQTPAKRFLAKGDYSVNSNNKIMFRFSRLDSNTDVIESNSSGAGNGNRRTSTLALNFSNSNYKILENIRSGVGEWNSIMGSHMANSLIVGYTHQDESRGYHGQGWGTTPQAFFPMVDILQDGSTYTSFGFEPFTPANQLRYNTFQAQDNFTSYNGRHTFTAGMSFEKYHSDNVFFPESQSTYAYNSLADFYTDAMGFLANPNRTTSPVTLKRFQVRYNNIPGATQPLQPLDVIYTGAYAQDDWAPASNVKFTAGVRVDIPFFGNTGNQNTNADALTFRGQNGSPVQYMSAKLPNANPLWSPRVGFNWDVTGDRSIQVRGGTGVFTGPPPYVYISNQVGNTGTLTGLVDVTNTTAFPFNPTASTYAPATVTGAPPASYELNVTAPNFKFPQVWRSDASVDKRLPWGLVGTVDTIYTRDLNGIYYINANLAAPTTNFTGADTRPRWVGGNKVNAAVADAVVLSNESVGRSWTIDGALTRQFSHGVSFKAGYSYGVSKDTIDASSIAFTSWSSNATPGDPNNAPLAYSSFSPGKRFFMAGSWVLEYLSMGATTFSMFLEGHTSGNSTYTFSGDLNGDGGTSNDLIYIPRDTSEMNFQQYTSSGVTFTAAQQTAAWDAYINQDPYLSKRRGQYAQRGAVFLPFVWRTDLSIVQEVFHRSGARRSAFHVRLDILNLGNLINNKWGAGWRLVSSQPLTVGSPAVDANGAALYRLQQFNGQLISSSFQQTAGTSDVYSFMVSFGATF